MARPIRPEEYQFPAVTNFADPLREIYKRQLDQKDRFHAASRDRDRQMVAASEDELNLVKSLANFAPTVKGALDKRQAAIDKKKAAELSAEYDELNINDATLQSSLDYHKRVRDGELKESLALERFAADFRDRHKGDGTEISQDYINKVWKLTSGHNLLAQEHAFRRLSLGHSKHYEDPTRGPQKGVAWSEAYHAAQGEAAKAQILREFRHERIGKYDFNPEAYVKYGQKGWQDFSQTVQGLTKSKRNTANAKFDEMQSNDFLVSAILDNDSAVGSNAIAEQYQIVLAGYSKDDPNRNRKAQAIMLKRLNQRKGLVTTEKLRDILDGSSIPKDMLHSGMKADKDGNISLSTVFFGKDTKARDDFFNENNRIWGERVDKERKAQYKGIHNQAIEYINNENNWKDPNYLTKIAEYQGKLTKIGSESKILAKYLEADLTPESIESKRKQLLALAKAGKYEKAQSELKEWGIAELTAEFNDEFNEQANQRKSQDEFGEIEEMSRSMVYGVAKAWKIGDPLPSAEAPFIAGELNRAYQSVVTANINSGDPALVASAVQKGSEARQAHWLSKGGGSISENSQADFGDPNKKYMWFPEGKDPKNSKRIKPAGFWNYNLNTPTESDKLTEAKTLPLTNTEKTNINNRLDALFPTGITTDQMDEILGTNAHRIVDLNELEQIATKGYTTHGLQHMSERLNISPGTLLEASLNAFENDSAYDLDLSDRKKELQALIKTEAIIAEKLQDHPDLLRRLRTGKVTPNELKRAILLLDPENKDYLDLLGFPSRLQDVTNELSNYG